jgi:hypothetical protein
MNAVALFLMLVLQGNPTCPAETPTQTSVATTMGMQLVQVQMYDCYWRGPNTPSHRFVVVSPVCPSYIGQPILVEEMNERKGWVMNRFGEFYPATVNIELMDIYKPACN